MSAGGLAARNMLKQHARTGIEGQRNIARDPMEVSAAAIAPGTPNFFAASEP